jgi:Asp-tRNA(Asn)/Glu-tRNA(Gln) amidotransferase A subunit family amidase
MLQIATLRNAYSSGDLTPTQLVEEVLRRVAAYADPAVWISRVQEVDAPPLGPPIWRRGGCPCTAFPSR